MARLSVALACALLLCGVVAQAEKRVLVLLNDKEMETTHGIFLKGLSARGYAVDVKAITDKSLQLKSWDEWLYDKLVIFGSSKGEPHRLPGAAPRPPATTSTCRAPSCRP